MIYAVVILASAVMMGTIYCNLCRVGETEKIVKYGYDED